ncbi:MAG: hypothetical protein ACK4E2_04095, partial [Pseudothermotoga sp.]
MPRKTEIVTKLSTQLVRFLLSRSAEGINIEIRNMENEIFVVIESKIALSEQDLHLLNSYLKVESHEEMAYYYLPLAGEYGSDEDLMLISMLVNSVEIDYKEQGNVLKISFV